MKGGWFYANLLNARTTPRSPKLMFGDVVGGVLELQAYTRLANFKPARHATGTHPPHHGRLVWAGEEFDKEEYDGTKGWLDLATHQHQGPMEVLCVLLHYSGGTLGNLYGLMISPVGNQSSSPIASGTSGPLRWRSRLKVKVRASKKYERIGVFQHRYSGDNPRADFQRYEARSWSRKSNAII